MSEIRMRFIGRQQAPYGEEVNRWEILTDAPEEEVWEFCKREICSNRPVKTKAEWEQMKGNFEEYSKGYVKLTKVGSRWWFEKHFPNLD